MKQLLVLTMLLSLVMLTRGQQVNLDDFNQHRRQLNRQGLAIIGSWAAANIVYNGIAAGNTSGSTRYFNKMNTLWNGVTLGLSAVGFFQSKQNALSLYQSLKKQSATEKVFLFNAALDVAYVVGGIYIKERSKNVSRNQERLKGYGESVILQGGVLFVFDGIMYLLHAKNGNRLLQATRSMGLAITPQGIGVRVKF